MKPYSSHFFFFIVSIVTFIICNAFELIKKFKLVVNFTISNVPDNGLIYHPKHQKEVLIKHGFVNKKNKQTKNCVAFTRFCYLSEPRLKTVGARFM